MDTERLNLHALELLPGLGDQLGEGGALYYLGAVQRLTGDYAAAAARCPPPGSRC
ncbi:MAG: hypothetical protein ABR926_22035 [Streptosporangiaceae bacterium]|jgi:hypothetical protein